MGSARSGAKRSNARGQASREQILGSAIELLRERGYAGLSITAICERAGIAPTSLYWHFENKAGLMEAVLGRISGRHTERIRAAIQDAPTPEARLDRLLAGLRELVLTQPLGSLTGVAVVGEGRHVTSELLGALRRAREQELVLIARDFEARLGCASPQAEALATVTTAITNYAALCYRMDRDPAEVDRILASLKSVLALASAQASAASS